MITLEPPTIDTPKNDQEASASNQKQSFLILQGHPSKLARDLGDELTARGYKVKRVNFCIGDWFFWHDHRTLNFRGRLSEWPEFLHKLIKSEGITDIVYYADRLPYHSAASRVAKHCGIRAISHEFGYLRPDWLILERGGQSIYSHFPNDLALIQALAKKTKKKPDLRPRYPSTFFEEARNEVLYNLSNYFLWYTFPHFECNKYYNPLVEYLAYIPRLILRRYRKNSADKFVENLINSSKKYFVVPLQMQNDYQIRSNSKYSHCREFIDEIMQSFAQNASPKAKLIFKVHPFDNGLERWGSVIAKMASRMGLEERVHYLDGGHLPNLLSNSQGVVTINSSTGLFALQLRVPVKVQGVSVYDIPGLTFQGELDAFWRNAEQPKRIAVRSLVKLLAASIHVKGSFFSEEGRKAAVEGFVQRLTAGQVNSHSGFVDPPPRLAKAQDMGIKVDAPYQPDYSEGSSAQKQD